MKQKKISSILIKSAILAGVFLLGSVIGIVGTRQYALYYGVPGNGNSDENKLITDKVAIVNLDEGVMVQDEKVNYAEKLIIDLDENFSFTGLEDARQGYATGIYAGYLIIPATFSESVVSLNNTPIRSEVSYAINSNLREDVKEEIIYEVLALMNKINDGVSYMYLHSVLDDVHEAQDAAVTVMNNDIEERDAIDAVQANDLVALVPVAEFTEIENNIEPVDVSQYMANNIELTGEIGQKYTEYLMQSEEEHLRINEEASALMDEMSNMSSIISNSNFIQNEEGGSVYQDGTEAVEALFEEYNSSLEEKESEIEENVLAIYKDVTAYLAEYDRAVEVYQTENEEAYRNTLEALENLFEEYSEGHVIVSEQELEEIENTMESQSEMLWVQQCIIQELQEDSEEQEDGGEQEESENVQEAEIYAQDTEIETEPLSALQESILQTLNDNYYFFSGYLLDEEGAVVKDENGESVLLTSMIEEYRKNLEDPLVEAEVLEKEIGEIEKLESSEMFACIDENILEPIQENVDGFVTEVMTQGYEEGIEKGIERGIRTLIQTCMELGVSGDVIIEKCAEKYEMTKEEAGRYMKECCV